MIPFGDYSNWHFSGLVPGTCDGCRSTDTQRFMHQYIKWGHGIYCLREIRLCLHCRNLLREGWLDLVVMASGD